MELIIHSYHRLYLNTSNNLLLDSNQSVGMMSIELLIKLILDVIKNILVFLSDLWFSPSSTHLHGFLKKKIKISCLMWKYRILKIILKQIWKPDHITSPPPERDQLKWNQKSSSIEYCDDSFPREDESAPRTKIL